MPDGRVSGTGAESARGGDIPRDEGFVEVTGGRVWYERMGRPDAPPLLLLHGGPGASSGYLQPLMAQAADDFLVVRYDQLGSWNSDKPDDLTLWQVPRFVAEVEQVRQVGPAVGGPALDPDVAHRRRPASSRQPRAACARVERGRVPREGDRRIPDSGLRCPRRPAFSQIATPSIGPPG